MALLKYIVKSHICRRIVKVTLGLVPIPVLHILDAPIIPNYTFVRYMEADNVTIESLMLPLPLTNFPFLFCQDTIHSTCLIPYHLLCKTLLVPRLSVLLS